MNNDTHPNLDPTEIAAAAQRAGIELDLHETTRWLVAMSHSEHALASHETGAFGSHVALLDFDEGDIAFFRRLARRVRLISHPNVESAIAISGSSAQGQVQLFPGDYDFFERVNIHAPDLQTAKQILRETLRATALRAFSEPDIVLIEANMGEYAYPVLERGSQRTIGDPITWTPQDVLNGYIDVMKQDRGTERIHWDDVDAGKGWTYLGWIIADRERGHIALASNMFDVTWQAPDGTLTSLDGSIDPFFQEIYLEPSEHPVFTKISHQISPAALDEYIHAMRSQVLHYTHEEPNFGKASKRLYNLFRLTDQLESAAYVRELFDESTARLYQVPGLLQAAEIALRDPAAEIDRATILRQIDLVMEQVREATEGPDEAEILRELSRLRHDVLREPPGSDWDEIFREVHHRCAAIVNHFFQTHLYAYAEIRDFIEHLKPSK